MLATLLTFSLPTYAEEATPATIEMPNGPTVTYFDDGSSLTITPAQITEDQTLARATSKSVTAEKSASYTDSNGDVSWKYTLTATFSYVEGVSSTCTSASYKKSVSDNSWSFSDGSATKSGNVATSKGT